MVTIGNSLQSVPDLGKRLADRLARDLFSGRYPPGAYLPKEAELCEQFDMSRASVRGGLQLLVALGMITRISGQGTLVREYRDWNLLDPLVTRWMADYAAPNLGFLREIFEFRHAVEPFIAMIAAQRATARDLVAIEDAFAGMEQCLENGQASASGLNFTDYDIEFHAAIYRATHNVVWSQLAHILRPSIQLVIAKSNDTADELRDSLGRHRRLMECIRLRQVDAAYGAARAVMKRTAFDLGLNGEQADDPALTLWKRKLAESDDN
jgi:DNA-binding FadR family transcriptional regulator